MPTPIYPCLWFDHQATEAARFYTQLFDDARILQENPVVTSFEIYGRRIIGLNGGPQFKINPSISLFLVIQDEKELHRLWEGLADGGEALMALNTYPWSALYGWIKDRYGMTWQLMIGDERHSQPAMTPSLLFTGPRFGQAEEAIRFYTTLFPHSDSGFIQHYPPGDEKEGKVLFSEFTVADSPFIAMDGPGEHGYTFNEGVSFVVECDTQEEIDHYWEALTRDGEESMCGWCVDPFGISWQIIPAQLSQWIADPDYGKTSMQAMLKMKKLIIADLLPKE
ncbi:MAG: VOC family protein [Saprospiraceae bacterium]|nr:VOC family protein [Saprospiraceae bacterium]